MGRHAPHLTVATFGDRDLEPGIRDGFAKPHRRVAVPQRIGRVHQPRLGGGGLAVFERDTTAQSGEGLFIRRAFDLHPIGFGQFIFRMRDTGLQRAAVSQHHQPFAVAVQPSGGVEAFFIDIGRQGRARRAFGALVGELGQDAKGFVEKDHAVHSASGTSLVMPTGAARASSSSSDMGMYSPRRQSCARSS